MNLKLLRLRDGEVPLAGGDLIQAAIPVHLYRDLERATAVDDHVVVYAQAWSRQHHLNHYCSLLVSVRVADSVFLACPLSLDDIPPFLLSISDGAPRDSSLVGVGDQIF
jgi:hypothetical protein